LLTTHALVAMCALTRDVRNQPSEIKVVLHKNTLLD
jgi:hypothetical protein